MSPSEPRSPNRPATSNASSPAASAPRRTAIRLLLILPYLGLLIPVLYARNSPMLWGIPFFYWYQLLWVFLASALIGFVYLRTRHHLD